MNPDKQGTKVAADYRVKIDAGQTKVIRLRLSKYSPVTKGEPFGKQFDDIFANRLREADEFYKSVTPPSLSEDQAMVMRQALSGMLWSKQFYFFDGDNWLDEHHSNPLHTGYSCATRRVDDPSMGTEKFQNDPYWRDNILFYEYFHGDNGAWLGASHQTGWTGLVAKLIQLYGVLDPQRTLQEGRQVAFTH